MSRGRLWVALVLGAWGAGAFYTGVLWEQAKQPTLARVAAQLGPQYGVVVDAEMDEVGLALSEVAMTWDLDDATVTHIVDGWEIVLVQNGEAVDECSILMETGYGIGGPNAGVFTVRIVARPRSVMARLRHMFCH